MIQNKVEVLRAACCIAGLDGRITPDERRMLEQLAEQVGVGQVSLNAMIERATSDPRFYQELFDDLRTSAENTMRVLFTVACADRELGDTELQALYHFAALLGMDDKRFNQYIAAARKKVDGGATPSQPSS